VTRVREHWSSLVKGACGWCVRFGLGGARLV
jgi:hypothetical protein